ncbi:MAG: pyridoxal phosphate-dependent aminotransferase, partial [Rhodobacteraceae bacterium]|nr:pyridoxal phosphate-dependent aminotransferase [Paracoccaceae bacterium]
HDVSWLRKTIADVEASRQVIAQIAADNDLVALPSATNFVTIHCGRDGDYARRILDSLVAQGVFVRMPFVAPQDRCIRISAGREQDLEFVAAALPKALADA